MKKYLLFVFLLIASYLQAQNYIHGNVTDEHKNNLEGVSIYYKNTTQGVSSNKEGNFQIELQADGILVFQYLGYKSQEFLVSEQENWQIQLEPEFVRLAQVELDGNEDPAYAIIRRAIAKREENKNRLTAYTASFYSRGLIDVMVDSSYVKKRQKKLLEEMDEDIKDTIVPYLSETISTIHVAPPDHFFEEITASKVSGDSFLFSLNSAEQAEVSFYENTIELGYPIISPIAHNALEFYEYRFEGDFYQDKQLINKISVSPKRPNSRVWTGTVYITEDSSEFYGVDLTVDSSVLQIPFIDEYRIRQTFLFDDSQKAWLKSLQEITFNATVFKHYLGGRFIAHYKEYQFENPTHKFSRERMRMLPDAIKTEDFWVDKRPVALTRLEKEDYRKKDSLEIVRSSKSYLDSIDRKANKLKPMDIIGGYTYRNSIKDWRLYYAGLESKNGYNTVQGVSLSSSLGFTKFHSEDKTNYTIIKSDIDYGWSDERTRVSGRITRKFNAINQAKLDLFAGTQTSQFNRNNPINPMVNSAYTIIDNRNYMKLYDLGRYGASYSQEITNGLFLQAETAWERRRPLYNTKIREKYADRLTSNNPLNPDDEASAPFDTHSLLRSKIGFQIRFAQDYYSHPNRKIITNSKGPTLYFGAIAGTFANEKEMDFLQLQTKISQSINMGQSGVSRYLIHAGTFVIKDELSFADFQHFSGNKTFIAHNNLESFELLPYYEHSTNQSYLAVHYEHHFRDAIMRRIPLIRNLKLQLVVCSNFLTVNGQKPYMEWHIGLDKIGIKNWRLLRVDFVQSHSNHTTHSGIRISLPL